MLWKLTARAVAGQVGQVACTDDKYIPLCFPSRRTYCYDTSPLRFREFSAFKASASPLRCEDQQLQSDYSSSWFLAVSGQQAKLLPGITPLPSIILPFILNRIGPVTMLSRQCCCKFMRRPEKDKMKSKNKQ